MTTFFDEPMGNPPGDNERFNRVETINGYTSNNKPVAEYNSGQASIKNKHHHLEDDDLDLYNYTSKIKIIGTGGAGNNTIYRTYVKGNLNRNALNTGSLELWSVNSDAADLKKKTVHNNCRISDIKRVLIGKNRQRGSGCGGHIELGALCAEDDKDRLTALVSGTDLIILSYGLGGGTGTGSGPVIARTAKGVQSNFGGRPPIVISVCTFPFIVEGVHREKNAVEGLKKIRQYSDTVIMIDNEKIKEHFGDYPVNDAFSSADELVISKFIKGLTDTLSNAGVINIDFADISRIMTKGGMSVVGVGSGKGHNKVVEAIDNSFKQVLFDVNYKTAKGMLINVIGGNDMTLEEAVSACQLANKEVGDDVDVMWGVTIDPGYVDRVDVITIFTGVYSPTLSWIDEIGKPISDTMREV